ncbi:hypothetical protein Tco_1421891, partial [Tanacetum coccineum]
YQIHEELFNALTWSIKLDESRSTQSTKPDQIPKKRDCGDDDKETRPWNLPEPSPDANTKQPYPAVAANPKRQKNDWYKKSPSLELQDPDWNTVKTINDAQEQPWFKEKVNAVVPLLTFDELMSTPIDFSTFAMNCLELTTLTREVLTNPEGYDRPDMGKTLPLIKKKGRLTIPVEVFLNNDLEYLKGDKAERTYCSSITKCPAASDGTLNSVHKTLHTRIHNLNLGFNPKSDMPNSAWSTKDQERTATILKKINVVQLKRRIMRSLEVLVGGRKIETDKRLLQRTV